MGTTFIVRPKDGRRPLPYFVRSHVPARSGLEILCARATRFTTNPVIIEVLKREHWEPCEGGVCW